MLQLTPDNLNLQGKSKKVRVGEISSYREFEANNRKYEWDEKWMQLTGTLQNFINTQYWTLYLNWKTKK